MKTRFIVLGFSMALFSSVGHLPMQNRIVASIPASKAFQSAMKARHFTAPFSPTSGSPVIFPQQKEPQTKKNSDGFSFPHPTHQMGQAPQVNLLSDPRLRTDWVQFDADGAVQMDQLIQMMDTFRNRNAAIHEHAGQFISDRRNSPSSLSPGVIVNGVSGVGQQGEQLPFSLPHTHSGLAR